MKAIIKNIYIAVFSIAILGISSCSNESPFETVGEAILHLNAEYRSDIAISTRANEVKGYTEEYLNENLVVYIENSKGVVRKYLGKSSIPESISLSIGSYTIEGWTGDSLSASFDKKFFRGYQDNIRIGEGNNSLSLKMDIANVVVSIDASVLTQQISDLKIKVYHPRGELVFTETEIMEGKRGYFMMPNDTPNLNYIIEGKNSLGESFTKSGEISSVERTHLYNLVFSTEAQENTSGGALIRLVIKDIPIINEGFEILPGPSFKAFYGNDDWNLEDQIINIATPKNFNDLKVRVLAYNDLKNLTLSFDNKIPGVSEISGKNLIEENNPVELLKSKNIDFQIIETFDKSAIKGKEDVKVIEAWLTFTSIFLNSLTDQSEEFNITIEGSDDRNYTNKTVLKIANTDDAIFRQDPVESSPTPDLDLEPMSVLANSAVLTGYLYDTSVDDYGFLYREKNSNEFQKVSAKTSSFVTRASSNSKFLVTISGLKPGTEYEYKSYAGDFIEDDTAIKTFITEDKYYFPNADMSQWSTGSDKADIPSSDGNVTFWDSGNHGSILMDINLTQKNTSFQPGNTVARLESQFVNVFGLGKFAAGNLFIGEFYDRDGTDGILHLGREFNASHPSALNVMVNYRPAKVVSGRGNKAGYLSAGQYDHGQIYVALSTEIVEIRTKTSNQKLFNPNSNEIIAYGEVSWDDEDGKGYGEDGKLELVSIPLKYKEIAKSVAPKYIIIVCSASKYGDYFCGGVGSVMYLDDFELEYGDIQWQE